MVLFPSSYARSWALKNLPEEKYFTAK